MNYQTPLWVAVALLLSCAACWADDPASLRELASQVERKKSAGEELKAAGYPAIDAIEHTLATPKSVDPARVKTLIENLNSSSGKVREMSELMLVDFGAPVVPLLQAAAAKLKNSDPQTAAQLEKMATSAASQEGRENLAQILEHLHSTCIAYPQCLK